jgi:hypothetical protein
MAKKKNTAAPSSAPEASAPELPAFLVVVANGVPRKRRCDVLFTAAPTLVKVADLAPGDYERLLNEPQLRCEPASELEAEVLLADLKERGDYGNNIVAWRVANARLKAENADLRQQVSNCMAQLALAKAAEERAASGQDPSKPFGGF